MLRWVSAPLTEKARVTWSPLTVSLSRPRPLMVRSSVTPSWLARSIEPLSPPANSMTSAPGKALAASMAARNEPGPLS